MGARFLGIGKSAMVGGLERTECSGWDARFVVEGAEGKVESMRVTRNHVEIMDSSDRGREGLTTDKGTIYSIK